MRTQYKHLMFFDEALSIHTISKYMYMYNAAEYTNLYTIQENENVVYITIIFG